MQLSQFATGLSVFLGLLPALAAAQPQNPRAERFAAVEDWVGLAASETAEGGTDRLWDLPGLRQAAVEAMGAALAREALRPAGPETRVRREGGLLHWSWCRRADCAGFGYVFLVDPRRGDLFVCRHAESGRQGWMGTDPRLFVPVKGRACDAANVTEFVRLNARP
jgi:hypothetical protein